MNSTSRNTRMRPALAALLLPLFVLGCAPKKPEDRRVSVKGSDTMVILGSKWAEIYMGAHPGRTIAVTGGGSGTGIAALINGTTDIAQSSRPMADKEKAGIQAATGAPVEEHVVARDGVTVYVHPSNPVASLTMEQLAGIYTGAITNWKDLGGPDRPITLYGRENSSGTYVFFKEHVLGGKDFAPATQTLPGTAAVVNAVTRDENGIGYGGIAYGGGVRHVPVAKAGAAPVEAKEETILDGSYPLSRPLYWYLTKRTPAAAREFLDWVKSPEGQAHVKDVGYFPA
jgi:phosphate transport system substrate-binding protein